MLDTIPAKTLEASYPVGFHRDDVSGACLLSTLAAFLAVVASTKQSRCPCKTYAFSGNVSSTGYHYQSKNAMQTSAARFVAIACEIMIKANDDEVTSC